MEILDLVLESIQNAEAPMTMWKKILQAPLAFLLTAGMAGCTMYAAKNPPTLASTTSAEQHERILWQMAQKQQWGKIAPLFSTTLVWNVDGKALTGDQVVSYLESLKLKDAVISNATFQPNGPDMTVSYRLQLSGNDGAVREYSAFSIWQQLNRGGYVLIAHSQHAQPGTATTASAQ